MGSSIQDYAKKINSKITFIDCVSLLITTIFLLFLAIFLYYQQNILTIPVTYSVGSVTTITQDTVSDKRPFASISGKTYTFSWCMGADRVSSKNRVYFSNEEEALASGRRISKLCTK